jgi:hypothetical protein
MTTVITTGVITEVQDALRKAIAKHPSFPSLHHAISVIDEEFIELKTEAYRQHVDGDRLRKEALHVAAMAIRLILDLDPQAGEFIEHFRRTDPSAPGFYKRTVEDSPFPYDEECVPGA